jgi:hypothetical protein
MNRGAGIVIIICREAGKVICREAGEKILTILLVMKGSFLQIWALFKKDLLLEVRQQYSFYGVLLYVASTIFVLYLAMGQPDGGGCCIFIRSRVRRTSSCRSSCSMPC